MNRSGFLLGQTFKQKQFIPYVEQPDENKNSIIPSRIGYDVSSPRPRMDMSDPNTTSEKLRKLTETASLTFDVLDPTDTKFVSEGRSQRMIKRSILPSSIPSLSADDMGAFIAQMELNNTARTADMKTAMGLAQTTLMTQLKNGNMKVMKTLKDMSKEVKFSNIPQYVFLNSIIETKQFNPGLRPMGEVIRQDIILKLITNSQNYGTLGGHQKQSNNFGNWLTTFVINPKTYNIGTIIYNENCYAYFLNIPQAKQYKYEDKIDLAIQDFNLFCYNNTIKPDPWIQEIEAEYVKIYGKSFISTVP